ncbi:unnamed protein product [Mytilus coruscus]|uniref:Uncharacterized protein n=1 Tax=Mytilus coruscus TaxID=42192 RepID=A0A6J8D313_MYTCO|nr:unnamed protein product [Mytilus coruscus]
MHINSVAEKNTHLKEITFYLDTCGGQNRNQYVAFVMLYALKQHKSIEIINHKLFECGHSEMEADSIHSAVERAKKNTQIYNPSQWDTVVSMARKKNPYIVIPMNFRDFSDLKSLRKKMCNNMKKTVDNKTINWLLVKWIKVDKASPDAISFNYCFEEEKFQTVNVQQSGLRGRKRAMQSITLVPTYDTKLPISEAKKADLLSLCSSGVIPATYHSYYENLPCGKSIKDNLPEPDMDEDDEYET